MEEVMMKAKKYKMERQQTALETSNKIEELDDQFDDSFKMLLGQASIRAEEKQEAAPRKPQDGCVSLRVGSAETQCSSLS